MKNLKTYKILYLTVLTVLAFYACSEDETLTLPEASHRVIVTSEMNYENTINIGGHIDFGDISSGVKSRTWTFPQNVSSISDSDKNTSGENTVKAFFSQAGKHNVTLHQVFKGDVYRNEDSATPSGLKELDTTIVVTVLNPVSSVLTANYINDDGSLGDPLSMTDNAENEITASKYVRLSYSSDGAPVNFVWNLNGGKPAQVTNPVGEVDVRYSKLGTHDLQFIASRSRPFDADTINIKNFIKVNPSTEPVTLDRVLENGAQIIGLEFSREMDPATVNKNNFSVSIETASGATLSPTISSIVVDNIEGNILNISLNGEILYNDDTIKVSYSPGVLATLDGVAATATTDAILTDFVKTNILLETEVDHSFESTTADNWPYGWWGGQWGEYDLNLSSNRAHTGDKSMYIEYRPEGGMILGNTDNGGNNVTFPVESGFNYEMGVWVFVDDLGSPDAVTPPDLRFYWTPSTNWGIDANVEFPPTFETGKWVYSSAIVQFSATENITYMIRGFNSGNSQTLKFYMDDLTVYKLTSRP